MLGHVLGAEHANAGGFELLHAPALGRAARGREVIQ
jgi:hypothetical protein